MCENDDEWHAQRITQHRLVQCGNMEKLKAVAVYLKPEQKARLEELAEERGMSASTFVRGVVLAALRRERPQEA